MPSPVANQTASQLAAILALFDGDQVPVDALPRIRAMAEAGLAFDPDLMRLRIDNLHGNRGFVQRIDGRWKALRIDGATVEFGMLFGHPADAGAIAADLSAATTIHAVQRAAMKHVRNMSDVQVEAIWERHTWEGGRFHHLPR